MWTKWTIECFTWKIGRQGTFCFLKIEQRVLFAKEHPLTQAVALSSMLDNILQNVSKYHMYDVQCTMYDRNIT